MHNYQVAANEPLTPTSFLLTLRPDDPARVLRFHAGQYAGLSFWDAGRSTPERCFSIVSAPADGSRLQFAVRVTGNFTAAARRLRPGDPVRLSGPYGAFLRQVAPSPAPPGPPAPNPALRGPSAPRLAPADPASPDLVCLAGGIGIAPFISYLRHAAAQPRPIQPRPGRLMLLYGVRAEPAIPFANELLALERQLPHLAVAFAVTQGNPPPLLGSRAAPGRVTPDLLDHLLGAHHLKFRYALCGPVGFTRDLATALRQRGVGEAAITTEDFGFIPTSARYQPAQDQC